VPSYTAGQKVTAAELNLLPQLTYAASDSTNAAAYTTSYEDADGLGFDVDADSRYLFEWYLFYNCGYSGDLVIHLTYPTGTTGWFSPGGVESAATGNDGSTGDFNGQAVALTGIHALSGWNEPPDPTLSMFAAPVAMVLTDSTAGTVQLEFALLSTGGAGVATVLEGSALRVTKLTL
jgi:hypothetical protein